MNELQKAKELKEKWLNIGDFCYNEVMYKSKANLEKLENDLILLTYGQIQTENNIKFKKDCQAAKEIYEEILR